MLRYHLQSQQAISSTQISCGERESDALNHWGVVKPGKQLQTFPLPSEKKWNLAFLQALISLISVPSSTFVNILRNLPPFPTTLAPPSPACISSSGSLGGHLLDIGVTCLFYFPWCPTCEFSWPWSPILHHEMHSYLSFLSHQFGLGTSPLYILLLSRKILSIKWILQHTMVPGNRALSVNQGVTRLSLSVR